MIVNVSKHLFDNGTDSLLTEKIRKMILHTR
jgi:hypothetical protein